eukprot:scaffold876_cov243-Pinguiococcus_pyrenoidosus.AAC.28
MLKKPRRNPIASAARGLPLGSHVPAEAAAERPNSSAMHSEFESTKQEESADFTYTDRESFCFSQRPTRTEARRTSRKRLPQLPQDGAQILLGRDRCWGYTFTLYLVHLSQPPTVDR